MSPKPENIIAYTEPMSLQPGQVLKIKASLMQGEKTDLDFVRINGNGWDPENGAIPDISMIVHPKAGTYQCNAQNTPIGSYATLASLRSLNAKIFVEYGQTEVMSTLAYSDVDASDEVLLNTVGKFSPSFNVRIANDKGKICTPGEVGEIQAQGDCVFKQYWGDTEQTDAAFSSDGWLKAGDLALMREDGNIVLKGRAREMIKTGGYNVYPREIEAVLEQHPAVSEIVVFSKPNELFGEAVYAIVELKSLVEAAPNSDDLVTYCREHLAGYKIPKIFHFTQNLPRLGNGKIDRIKSANIN